MSKSRDGARTLGEVESGKAAAGEVLDETLAGLPASEHGYLRPGRRAHPIPMKQVADPDWLDTQVGLQAARWPSVDRRVLATLWWYSISQVFLTPTLASLFVTGRALSPRPADVGLHVQPDGRVFTAESAAVLGPSDSIEAVAGALRQSFEFAIPAVAKAGARRERPLWAIASDSLANRMLWLGRAVGESDRATTMAASLAELIGAPLPLPRYVDVERHLARTGQARFVRRSSCCLIYFEPGEPKCASCPRLTPATRAALLRKAADRI